jgi:hypothetical protein
MKRIFCTAAAIAALLFANTLSAQEKTTEAPAKKKGRTFTISNKGVTVEATDSTTKKKAPQKDNEKVGKPHLTFTMLDLGVNLLNDNTDYTNSALASYLNVPAAQRNANLFDLKNGKSINVNIYPLMVKLPLIKTKNQRLYVSTGIGLQVYNFRYENPLTYTKNPNSIIMDSISFKKDKLAVNYANIPLMFTAKTRLHKDSWLVYGAGVTAGYRLSSWNKQVSSQRGKIKTHGNFDLEDFNTCVTAEFGVEGIIRFYGSYQLTSMYQNNIDQRPISVGIRIGGI